jgi:Cu/Ag efflux pump CusA
VVAIGVVVDDAIIDVENIVRRLRRARAEGSGVSTFSIVLDASVEVRSAITYATLINVVAIVPVFFLEGLSGSFFRPLVLSYGLAVLVSMLVALTVTPALCLLLLSGRRLRASESPLLRVLKRGYGAILARVIRRPSPAIVTAAACLLAGLLIFPTLGSSLLPNFKERDFLMHWLTQPGTGVDEEQRVSIRGCKTCARSPVCATAGRTSGRRCSRTRSTASTSARTGSASTPTSTTTGRSRRSTGPSRAIPASTATSRPICASGSRRCSREPASRSSCASSVPT